MLIITPSIHATAPVIDICAIQINDALALTPATHNVDDSSGACICEIAL